MQRFRSPGWAAFTMMELLTVIVVIGILATLLISAMADIQYRADRANCVANLKNLYTGAAVYLQEKGSWPQIDPKLITGEDNAYAQQWIDALAPYGISRKNWICPSVQRLLLNPDVTLPENTRVDYTATPFDAKPTTPILWPKQPWFVERAAVHGGGNLIIFTNGQISSLKEAMQYH